jgi:hypothetical protein
MICSASNDIARKFESMEIPYTELPELVRGKYGSNYSAGTFINSHRTKDNYIKRQNLIIFDVDEGTTIQEALLYLEGFRGFIATTRNHLKEKNGKVEERFRIILVSKYEFNLDHEVYKETLSNFALFFNLTVDFPTIEPARLYYSNPESDIVFIDGEELIDLRDFIPETKEVVRTRNILEMKLLVDSINIFLEKYLMEIETTTFLNTEWLSLNTRT